MDNCAVCLGELGRKQVVSCSECSCMVHRLCDTGITQSEYHQMRRGEITIKFVCTACKGHAVSAGASTVTTEADDSNNSVSYGLRGTDKRRKPSRLIDCTPPTKHKKPHKKREPTVPKSQSQPSKKTASFRNGAATPEKGEPSSDWYFYSPSPMRRVHTEEKDGQTVTYFDDPGPIPATGSQTSQPKKTRRIWVRTNRCIFITTPPSKADSVFKTPTHCAIKRSQPKRKREADNSEPTRRDDASSSEAPLTKRQRTDCTTTNGSLSAMTSSSYRSGMSVTLNSLNRSPFVAAVKRKADETELTPGDSSVDRKVKKRRVDFRLDSSDLEVSLLSNSCVTESLVTHSFQSVSDIFNMSSGNEMDMTYDSIGNNYSFNHSYNSSFYDSYSHLAELI